MNMTYKNLSSIPNSQENNSNKPRLKAQIEIYACIYFDFKTEIPQLVIIGFRSMTDFKIGTWKN